MMIGNRVGLGSVIMTVLILLLPMMLRSLPAVVHAQDSSYVDETGKIGGIFLRPGSRDEFKSNVNIAWSHTLDTLRGAQGGAAQQDQITSGHQDYAILSSRSDSIGDFQFDFWVLEPVSDIRIYMPSNFTFGYSSSGHGVATGFDKVFSVWTDITNDYSYISVRTLGEDDPIAPGWECIEVGRIPSAMSPLPSFQIVPGLYHIRLFQIRAPFTGGLYHFKIYVNGESIGEGNFPITIVESSLEPAYVRGRVSLLGLEPSTLVSGRVVARSVTKTGTYAETLGYFGPGDLEEADDQASYYRYWLFGLPAGTHELIASASGFQEASLRFSTEPGQSVRLRDIELQMGVKIHVKIWSKDESHAIPWGNLWQLPYGTNDPSLPVDDQGPHRDIQIRLFDQHEELVGYWASDDVNAPYGPPWSDATIDGKRGYSPLLMKPSTVPSSSWYSSNLTDCRGLPSIVLDGHVPADAADFVEGIGNGSYTMEFHVTGYVMKEGDAWQRSFAIARSTRAYSLEVDLRRSNWILSSVTIPRDFPTPLSPSTLAIVVYSTDNIEKGLAAGEFPAAARRHTMVVEGFNSRRLCTECEDYGLAPLDYRVEAYMADMGSPYTGNPGVGWYTAEDPKPETHTRLGTGSQPAAFRMKPFSVEFVLRSIRLGEPTNPAPWMFPGAGIRVLLIDEAGRPAGTLDSIFYGLVQDDGTIIGDPYDADTTDIGHHSLLRVVYTGIDPGETAALSGSYPTHIEEGKYFVKVATFGYIQRRNDSTYIVSGVRNSLKIDLAQGAHIRVELEFKHAGVPTAFNGFARVEVCNQQGDLVGASIYVGAQANENLFYLQYDASKDWKLSPGAAEGAGTELEPQRAFFSMLHYGVPPLTWANWPALTPSDANRLSMPAGAAVAFDVFGFHSYYGSSDSRNDRYWANGWDTTNGAANLDSGIRGSRDAFDLDGWGRFTVKVWAFDPYGPDGVFESDGPDGIFGTDDDYTSLDPADASLSDFRAYAQVNEVTNLEARWGSSASVRVTLDEEASLLGVVYRMDMYGNLRTLGWAQVIERASDGAWTSSATGSYRLWLSAGPHEIFVTTVAQEQLWKLFVVEIALAGRGAHVFQDVILTSSAIKTAEFSGQWMAVTVFAAALVLFSRSRSKRVARLK